MLAMGIGSFILIDKMYESRINEIIANAENDNRNMFLYVVSLYETSDREYMRYAVRSFQNKEDGDERQTFIGNSAEWQDGVELSGMNNYEAISEIAGSGREAYIQVTSCYGGWYMVNKYSFRKAVDEREQNFKIYRVILVVASGVMALILYTAARWITLPIDKLTIMAKRISDGDYHMRINIGDKAMKTREIGQLGENFNRLAENIEGRISELNDMLEKRETFMADFTHEIKTPLTSIIGYGDILRTYDTAPEKRREYGEYIYMEGKRLERLSLNLLQLIVMGKQELELKKTDINVLMKNIRGVTRFLGEKYGVYIEFNISPVVIEVEQSLFSTAVINLIDNACKASEKGQTVYVSCISSDCMCVTSVRDEGRGIPSEQVERIMEPFYMVDKSRARKQGGAGIGLAICTQVAKLHGGFIKVESIEGAGTTMSLHIPLPKGDSV